MNIDPELAARLAVLNDPTIRDTAGSGAGNGSRITDIISAMMAQDGTNAAPEPISNVQPPRRPSNAGGTNETSATEKNKNFRSDASTDPTRQPGGTDSSAPNPTAVAEDPTSSSYSSDIMRILTGLGLTGGGLYALGKMGNKTLPPEAMAPEDVAMKALAAQATPKALPPAAGGPSAAPNDRFAAAFGNDIPDAEYREVIPKQVDERKKLPSPDRSIKDERKYRTEEPDATKEMQNKTWQRETSDEKDARERDNVKKADGEVITGKDGSKATTAKEKVKAKPKVRVK